MTPKQNNHLRKTLSQVEILLTKKYIKGSKKNDLLKKTVERLIDEAIEENLDSLVYLLRAKELHGKV